MITNVDAPLCEDIERFVLKFTCEDCIHFERDSLGCSLGFATDPHRKRPVSPGTVLVFCKTFECE